MHRGLSLVVFAAVALAQVPKEDPIMVATMAYQKARNQGNYGEAGAQRELARTLLIRFRPILLSLQTGSAKWSCCTRKAT